MKEIINDLIVVIISVFLSFCFTIFVTIYFNKKTRKELVKQLSGELHSLKHHYKSNINSMKLYKERGRIRKSEIEHMCYSDLVFKTIDITALYCVKIDDVDIYDIVRTIVKVRNMDNTIKNFSATFVGNEFMIMLCDDDNFKNDEIEWINNSFGHCINAICKLKNIIDRKYLKKKTVRCPESKICPIKCDDKEKKIYIGKDRESIWGITRDEKYEINKDWKFV